MENKIPSPVCDTEEGRKEFRMKEEKSSHDGKDQGQNELVTHFGNTVITQTKDSIIVQVPYKTRPDFQSNGDLNK